MNDLTKMWRRVLAEIESEVTQANFSTWFKETTILREEDGTIYLGVPNSFTQEWLEKKFHNRILRILRKMDSDICDLQYVIVRDGIIASPFVESGHCIKDIFDNFKEEVRVLIKEFKDEILAAINK